MSASPDDASQTGFAYRFDWGVDGLEALAPCCDVIVVVDILRFTSAVSVAVDAGATVYRFRWNDARAEAHATRQHAVLAGPREDGGPSLSPTDLLTLPRGTRLVLPSPNGSTIASTAAEHGVPFVLAGSFRNVGETARRALELRQNGSIGVIAAGERWHSAAGPLRPALEDLLGAGAVLAALDPSAAVAEPRCSPEALMARAAFVDAKSSLTSTLMTCASGRELVARGGRTTSTPVRGWMSQPMRLNWSTTPSLPSDDRVPFSRDRSAKRRASPRVRRGRRPTASCGR